MHRPSRPTTPRRRGFTLLELILLLAAISIVATIAIPRHFARPEVTLIQAAELLVRDVDAARRIAVLSAEPVELHLAPDGYRLTTVGGESLGHPRTGTEFHRDYDRDAVFRGVSVLSPPGGDRARIRFDPLGGSSGAEEIQLAFDDRRIVIRVDPTSATARVEASRP